MTEVGSTGTDRLRLENLSKSFGDRTVLRDVTLGLGDGEILGLVGENGAGKSTLLNILSGVFRSDGGTIRIDGEPAHLRDYRAANERGIFRVYQDAALIRSMSVEQNLLLGWEGRFRAFGLFLDRGKRRRIVSEALERVGLAPELGTQLVDSLSVGIRQYLAIAKVAATVSLLGTRHPIVLFDEPTTSLDSELEKGFFDFLRDLKGDGGSAVFVSHLLPEILRSCDRVVVLKDGAKVADVPTSEVTESALHRLMVGRERLDNYYLERRQGVRDESAEVLRVSDLAVTGRLAPTSFTVHAGEVLGIAGLEGSGKVEAGAAIGGAIPHSGGVAVRGHRVVGVGTRAAMRTGIAYVPADRVEAGILLAFSIERNIQLASLHDRLSTRLGFVRHRRSRAVTEAAISGFSIKT